MWYGVASLVGSFLLFFLQPLVGKAITPWYGGGASVWVTCMIFFQAVLLVGYGYAHFTVRQAKITKHGLIHGCLVLLSVLTLAVSVIRVGAPFLPLPEFTPASPTLPVFRILGTLALGIGIPMALLSSTSPLVQSWYSAAKPGQVPYRLYALSNVGSVAGLLAYPFAAEPFLSLHAQAWTAGALFVLWAAAMLLAWRHSTASGNAPLEEAQLVSRPTFKLIAGWAGLSALGSMLLVGGSNYLGWHIAAVPLLWILPLLLYLLTFILVFERDLHVDEGVAGLLLKVLFLMAVVGLPYALFNDRLFFLAVFGGLTVFAGCLLVHGRLASLRPHSSQLTWFYLALAAGGVLGGLSGGVLAPLVFARLHEFGTAILGICVACLWARGSSSFTRWSGRLLLCGTAMAVVYQIVDLSMKGNRTYRDFYGTVVVDSSRPVLKVMLSGFTIHGMELKDYPLEPLAYFGQASGIGRAMATMRSGTPHLSMGIIGLGVGNSAAYAQAGDKVRIYEISPKVIALSGLDHPKEFNVLASVPAKVNVVPGDARLSLEREFREGGSQGYHVLLVDAFSGGNIPWHLITAEAVDLYLKHMQPNGMLVFHVSNHFPVDLLVLRLLQDRGLNAARIRTPNFGEKIQGIYLYQESNYVIGSFQENNIMNNAIAPAADGLLVPGGAGSYGREFAERERLLKAELAHTPLWKDGKNGLSSLFWIR